MRFVKSNVIQRFEQVIQTDLTLESIGILSLCDTEGRNHFNQLFAQFIMG